MKKIKTYKGFIIAKDKEGFYHVFRKDEWIMGEGYRYSDMECGSIEEAKEFIDCY